HRGAQRRPGRGPGRRPHDRDRVRGGEPPRRRPLPARQPPTQERDLMRNGLAKRLSQGGVGFRRLGVLSWIALGVVVVIVLAAVFAPVLAPPSPYVQETAGGGPSGSHWMGLDSSNRDIFSRLLYGARWSLIIGLGATGIALVAGALLGSIAATSR